MSGESSHNRRSLFIVTAIMIMVAVIGAQNMFAFPYYHSDEGTHLANGWSVATDGQLSPYTYAYEDPPTGSILFAFWTLITGGPSAFGFSINTGRVLMLILHVISTALVYGSVVKLSKSDVAAAVAALVFALSPLAASLQRIFLLENVMLVWMLASFYLAVGERRTLKNYFGSAGFFGLALLTKGSALFFLPSMFYTVRTTSDKLHRRFATVLWLAIVIAITSFYPLYAQMKEELFPEDWALGGDFPHVSLIERLSDRGPETGRFLNYANGLSAAAEKWLDIKNPTADPVLIYGGIVASIFVVLLALDDRKLRPLLAMLVGVALHLLFGGAVYNIDAIMLLPFLAMSVGIIIGKIVELFLKNANGSFVRYALALAALALMLYPFWSFNANRLDLYTVNQVDGQIEATEWVAANLPQNTLIVTDNYAFTELRETHPNVHNYWRVDTDPAVKFNLLRDDLCNIDYIIATPQIYADIETFDMQLMRKTIDNSVVLMTYPNNGWPVEIRQVKKTECAPQIASRSDAN